MGKSILLIPLVIVISLATTFVLLLFEQWIWAAILFSFVVILNWWSETFAFHVIGNSIIDYDFRVLTFNINRAHKISNNDGTTEELIELILQQNADLVLLQEYNTQLYPTIQEVLGRKYPYSNMDEHISRFKSVYSKYPIESCEQLMVDANTTKYELFNSSLYSKKQHESKEVLPICRLKVRINDRLIQVFNCHLMSNNYSVVVRNLRKKGICLFLGFFSILRRIDFGYKTRKLQAEIMCEHIDCNLATLICGDFNDVSGSSCINLLKRAGLSDAWWSGGKGYGVTFNGMGIRLRLDHILYTAKMVRLNSISVPHTECSDHNPIIADFNFE